MTFQEKGDQEHSKLNNMKRQRNIQQIRDHGKNPQDQINEDEISSIAEKIQSDDSKDDPKSQKQNGENHLTHLTRN